MNLPNEVVVVELIFDGVHIVLVEVFETSILSVQLSLEHMTICVVKKGTAFIVLHGLLSSSVVTIHHLCLKSLKAEYYLLCFPHNHPFSVCWIWCLKENLVVEHAHMVDVDIQIGAEKPVSLDLEIVICFFKFQNPNDEILRNLSPIFVRFCVENSRGIIL